MPSLAYPTGDFQPFTKILSSEVNGKFNAIKTLLNTTKLDSTNVQLNGLTRDRLALGTANYAVYNDGTGQLTEAATLPATLGGTGLSYTPSAADAQKVLQVNALGTALTFDVAPAPPNLKIFSFYRFG